MARKLPDIVSKVLADYGEDRVAHDKFVERADACYRSYRAVLERRSEAAAWTPKQHPAYVLQAIETMTANLLSPNPKWRLRALPMMDSPDELERSRRGARANEILLSHQLTLDHYAAKQRSFDLQGLITGITASKQSWLYRKGRQRSLQPFEQPVYGFLGQEVDRISGLREEATEAVLRDDPTFEVVDVRHLILHQGAPSLAACERVSHRVFYSMEKLRKLEAEGFYGPKAGGSPLSELNLEETGSHQHFTRENELFQTQPHKDEIEVLEQWREGGKRVVTVAAGHHLLADKPNPFWFEHLEHPYPFVVCSGMPDLFRVPGISEVELMAELQEMLWSLINQRLMNLQLINNAIFLIADDVEDPDSFEFAPGERWLVPRPVEETVKTWNPDITAAQVALDAERFLRGDIQNITGGMPFLAGTESGNVDQETATGVSIITSLAQKRLAAKQQQFIWAKARIGEQWCALNQQFIRTPRLIPVIGADGAQAFEEVRPELLQGRYLFEVEMADESLIRQERRAEAQAKFQIAAQSAPVLAATGTPLNLRAFMEDVLDAYDVTDKERYFAAQPQALGPAQAQPAAEANGQPNGVTNPALAAGIQAPSNPESMSPEVFMQRMGATQGGPANV